MALYPTAKKRHNGGNDKASPKTCIRHPTKAVYEEGEFSHQHCDASKRYGFFYCEGELVRKWPKTPRNK